MVFVETQTEADIFIRYWENYPSTIYPIWVDLEKHPMNNQLAFLYIFFEEEKFVI